MTTETTELRLIINVWEAEDEAHQPYDYTGWDYSVGEKWVILTQRDGPGVAVFSADIVHSLHVVPMTPGDGENVVEFGLPRKSGKSRE